ncbi:lachesin-like isoform X2 [Portunus trituberculatus]|uniref:lachesin-like isoform X2 n=1 Tax=Portunus trituberculatus TaxID=210409 RepID=UPI001E1CF931|nr:lachesin-like isoform X2 [Portunus trituberculatus]XP_045133788.1 lachesin-like isoform X2 [Portunus trituberculatus]
MPSPLRSCGRPKMASLALCLWAHVAMAGGAMSEEPRFVEPIQNVTVAAGRDVKLSCVVDNLSTFKVAWIAFDKSAILTVQEHVITRNPRVNVTYDGHRTWTLHLSRVNATDAGTYMCQVNTIVAKSQFGILNVVVPPNIVDGKTSGDVMVQEGANITLECSATGTPMPTITWRREDHMKINLNKTYRVMEHTGPKLHLARISRMDMAAYLCIARNGVPPIVSKRMQVSVDFPPMMSIPHQLVGAPLGYSITLECTIEAHPPALTYWTRGSGIMLHQGRKYYITERKGDVPYRTHMKLTIKSLKPDDDFGEYRCVAKNSRGETEGEIKLYETEPPTPAPTSPPSYLDKLFKDYQQKTTNSVVGKGEGKATFVGLEEPREGIETDMSIGDGDLMERNEIDRLEEGAHWDDDRQREVEARRERGRHEQSEYPMTNYFGSATPAGGGMGGYLRLQVLLPLVVLAQPSCLLLFL